MAGRSSLTTKDVISEPVTFPNDRAAKRLEELVGLEEHADRITRDLRLIFDPHLADSWSQEHYGELLPILGILKDTVPLIVFEGDVGTGKTALAEAIGQRVAVEGGHGVHLVKMNTQVRGSGYVGEMGTLLAASFKHVENVWKTKGEPVIFLVDEADSLLTTRDAAAQHHEDKSGVNTILQHLDSFRTGEAQVAVIAVTNRGNVLDPAIRRRATAMLTFSRPSGNQCEALFRKLFGFALDDDEISALVGVTEDVRNGGPNIPFTYSDLTLRFAIPSLRNAICEGRKLDPGALVTALRELDPSPPMRSKPIHEPEGD